MTLSKIHEQVGVCSYREQPLHDRFRLNQDLLDALD